MSDLAALEILASINKLASEIKYISVSPVDLPLWKQPWVGTIVGVVVGFSLNSWKDRSLRKSQVRDKLKCINAEIEDLRDNAAYGVKCCVEFLNTYDKNNNEKINVQLPVDANSYCFEKFYIDVVLRLTSTQRTQMIKTYKHLKYSTDLKSRFIKNMAENVVTNKQKETNVSALIMTYASVYFSAKCYLNGNAEKEYRVGDIIKELGIQFDHMDKVDTLNKASQ